MTLGIRVATLRFLRVVDQRVRDLRGVAREPLVLACVDYCLPSYRAVTHWPHVFDAAVSGVPERHSLSEPHAENQSIDDE